MQHSLSWYRCARAPILAVLTLGFGCDGASPSTPSVLTESAADGSAGMTIDSGSERTPASSGGARSATPVGDAAPLADAAGESRPEAESPSDAGALSAGPSDAGSVADSASPTCTGSGLSPGDHDARLDYLGHVRSYRVHVPKGYTHSAPIPLVLLIHGLSVDGPQQQVSSQLDVVADMHGFAVVYPSSDSLSWNAGGCCNASGPDDVLFMRELVARVQGQICVDRKRIYASGASNGGAMSHRLGCDAADLFAAVAPVAAPVPVPDAKCKPVRPISVLQIHGTNDTLVGYDGGGYVELLVNDPDTPLLSAPQTIADWARRNQCASGPSAPTPKSAWPTTPVSGGAVPGNGGWIPDELTILSVPSTPGASCEWYGDCAAATEVGLCTHDGAHDWPTGSSTAIWKFFARHPMP